MKRILSALFVAFGGLWSPAFAQQPPLNPPIIVDNENRLVAAEQEIVALERELAAKPADKNAVRELYYAHSRLGWHYLWARKYDEAIKAHQRAAELDRKYLVNPRTGTQEKPPKLITQADVLLISGWDEVVRGNHTAASQAYQQALELNPALAEAHYELGRLYLLLKRKEEAERQMLLLAGYDKSLALLLHDEMARDSAPPVEAPGPATAPQFTPLAASASLRPTIIYKEKAKYTESARQYRVVGTVLVSAVFRADGRLTKACRWD